MQSRWFGTIELGDQPAASDLRVINGLIELLDQLDPGELDPAQSSVRLDSDRNTVTMAHRSDRRSDIEIVLRGGSADLWSIYGLDECYSTRRHPDEWERDILDGLRELLRGSHQIDEWVWRGKPRKTVITDLVGGRALVSYAGLTWWVALLPGRRVQRRRRTVDYGCRSAGGADLDRLSDGEDEPGPGHPECQA